MAKLTTIELKAIKIDDAGMKLREDGGLIGTVRAGSDVVSVYFDWRYRFAGKVRQIAVGSFPKNSLSEIRAKRDEYKRILDIEKKDPAEEKRLKRIKIRADQAEAINFEQTRINDAETLKARITVRDLFNRWEKTDLIRRKDGGKEIRRMFEKDVLPILGIMAVEDVRKGHITEVTDALLSRGVNRMAKLIFSLVRQMFRFAVDRDIIDSDPSASIRKAKIGGKAVERDRVLSEDEVRELCRKLPDANLMPSTKCAIWIMLSTLCRVGEILKSKWEHLDFDAGTWMIPAENSKNGKPHLIKLSEFAAQQFRLLEQFKESETWIFPNRDNTNHVNDKTIAIQLKGRQTDKIHSNRTQANTALMLPGGNWTPHDLRRTGATMMTALGILPEIAERCLNHTEENKMKRTYQRHSYETEKREAWRLLGERLELLTRTDAVNVVTLQMLA